ncbi:Tctex-1 [Dipodascopsis uninucleata]
MATPRVPEETALSSTCPIPIEQLNELCKKSCEQLILPETTYAHDKTTFWNEALIKAILKSLIDVCPTHKFIVYSTIIQNDTTTKSRGIHSTSGAYWNSETDGMYNFQWAGGVQDAGLNIVISITWIRRD